MNPYTQQTNQSNPYSFGQNFMPNLPPELSNSFANHQSTSNGPNSNSNSPQPMFDQQMATMMAKRQMYASNPMFNLSSSMENPLALSLQSPQLNQNPMMTSQQQQQQQHILQLQQLRNPQPQQQAWLNKHQLALQRMDEQQKRQYLMLQQQQQIKKAQQLHRQPYLSANKPEAEEQTAEAKKTFSSLEIEKNSKRVEIILTMNQELIRLFVENRNAGRPLESDMSAYQTKLQSNLTFLATMADISMVKPGEDFKTPPPPDLSPLPSPKSEIGRKIHEILNSTISLFEKYPASDNSTEPQMQRKQSMTSSLSPVSMQQQQQQNIRQQQINMSRVNALSSMSPSTIGMSRNSMMDPQSILRQAQQQQSMIQQQQIMANIGLNMSSSSPNNPDLISGFSPIQNATDSPTSIPSQQPQLTPNDLLAANNMINPNSMLINPNNNIMLGAGNGIYTPENVEDYSNVMLMMQRLQ